MRSFGEIKIKSSQFGKNIGDVFRLKEAGDVIYKIVNYNQ
jgi:hypothetical protein